MKRKHSLLLVFLVIVLTISHLTISLISHMKDEENLRTEIYQVLDLINTNDLTSAKKKLTVTISKNNYQKVEQAIKKYLTDVIEDIELLNKTLSSNDITTILTIESIKKQQDSLINIIEIITALKQELNSTTIKMITYLTNDKVMSYIENAKLDKYYLELYNEYVVVPQDNIRNNINNLKMNVQSIINYLDTCEEIIIFLNNNRNYWSINEDKIIFTNDNLLNEYNTLIDKLK